MKLNPALIILVWTACIMSGCGTRPSHVLSEKKMENVLYDLYLADAEVEENYEIFANDSAKKQEILDAVFKKHKIKERDFDTSLVWYAGNLDKYYKIYQNLSNRYTTLADALREKQDLLTLKPAGEDQFNLWMGETTHTLRSADQLDNRITFRVDSGDFQLNDSYELRFNVLGIRDSIAPIVTFCLQNADTILSVRNDITANGTYSTVLTAPGDSITKVLYGSIYIPAKEKNILLSIYNFGIYQRKNVEAVSPNLELKRPTERITTY